VDEWSLDGSLHS